MKSHRFHEKTPRKMTFRQGFEVYINLTITETLIKKLKNFLWKLSKFDEIPYENMQNPKKSLNIRKLTLLRF